jgi:hypothetical protein
MAKAGDTRFHPLNQLLEFEIGGQSEGDGWELSWYDIESDHLCNKQH